jgi:ribosomal protein S14
LTIESIKIHLEGLNGRVLEDEIYRIVWEEIESNVLDGAAKARSIEEGAGDEGKTRAAYIKHRVRRIKDELELHRRELDRHEKSTKQPPKRTQSVKTHCQFCGRKLGFLMRNAKLCSDCSNKILSTAKKL